MKTVKLDVSEKVKNLQITYGRDLQMYFSNQNYRPLNNTSQFKSFSIDTDISSKIRKISK